MEKFILILIFFSLIILLLFFLLYYINKNWFNSILKNLANKIDPEGNSLKFDKIPQLPQKDKLEFKKLLISSPINKKIYNKPFQNSLN